MPDSYGGGIVYLSSDGYQFTADESNRHYRAFLLWCADGNTASEWNADAITESTVEPETTQPDMEEGN